VIFSSVLMAVMLNFVFVFSILKLFGYSKETIVTMLPRSMTAAVGIEVSDQLGGIDTITVMFIITTGLIGSILGAYLLRLGRFRSSIAKGMTYGNASHAFGTAQALDIDSETGAYSSIGMILTAVLSSIVLPILILFLY
ncbi:LrgB family protein, partial [Streptococcus pneumoniae]